MPAPVAISAEDWISPKNYGGVDLRSDPDPLPDSPLDPMVGPDGQWTQPTVPVVLDPTLEMAPEQDDEPVILQTEDGVMTLERTKKGWKGSIDVGTGSTQNFYGKTKDELVTNLLKAQANATKKIREQNRTIKFGVNESIPPVQKMDTPVGRKLTADEIAEVKLLQETDPEAAFEKMFTIKTGKPLEQFTADNERGRKANLDLVMESVAKGFVAKNPDYFPDPKGENYQAILSYLSKTKLRRQLTPQNEQEIAYMLVSNGQFTVDNLEEAYTELKEDGLLLATPRPQTPQPAPEQRIVRTETRARAGYGIPQSETTQTPKQDTTPSSDVMDFRSLSTEEIKRLMQETGRLAASQKYPNR